MNIRLDYIRINQELIKLYKQMPKVKVSSMKVTDPEAGIEAAEFAIEQAKQGKFDANDLVCCQYELKNLKKILGQNES